MKKLNLIIIILILFAAITRLHADDKVRIILHRPPPNQMDIGDMWNITLTNTTKEDLKIYLTGTATEEKDGLIVEGKSKVFTIKPGKTSYKYNDFTGAEIKYNNSKYKEIMLRQGNAPEGNYTICVTAFLESGDIAGQENCIIHPVNQMGSITLISPEDGGEITREQPIIFSWTPLPGAKDYTLRIVEIKGDQSPEVAMKTNKPVWEKSGIATTTIQVPYIAIDEPGLKIMDKKKKWGWQVISGEVESDVWAFSITSCGTLQITTKVECSKKEPGKYDYTLTCYNPSSDADCIMTINNPITLSIGTINTMSVSLPQNVDAGQTLTITGTLTASANGNFNISVTGPEFNGNYTPSYSLIKCNCCDDVIKKISLQLNSDGTKLTTDFKVGPNKIKQVRMNLVYINSVTDKNCPICKSNPAYWGNFNWGDWYWVDDPSRLGIIKFGNPADIHHRELTWVDNNGIDMFNTPRRLELGLLLDEILISSGVLKKCCKTELKYCIRYSFTDTACVTCDTVLCSKFVYGGNDLPRNDTIRTNYRDVEELMQMKMQNKEYQKDGEGQGESDILEEDNRSITYQQNDSCINFENNTSVGNWHKLNVDNISINRYSSDYINNTMVLELVDGQHGSLAWNNDEFSGNWINMAENGCLCLDYKVNWDSDVSTIPINYPKIQIYTGPPITSVDDFNNNRLRAAFIGNPDMPYIQDNRWLEWCLSVGLCENGNLPSNEFGHWVVYQNGVQLIPNAPWPLPDACEKWNILIQNVTGLVLATDYNDDPSEHVFFDNFCWICESETSINCCDSFNINVTGNIDHITKDKVNVRFEAGPNRIKRVMANIIDFTITHNDETSMGTNCSPCIPNSDQWGNFKNTPTSISGLGAGKLTVPSSSGSAFSREIVWGSLNGPGINMTGGTSWLTLPLSLPPKHSSSCCVDTVKFCVKYKFMDTTCVECDTAICYRIIRKGNIIINFKEEKLEKNEGMNIDENNDNNILNSQFTPSGQSAGIINLDLQNKSEVKVTVYDAGGKEKLKLYDDYLKAGQYSFDLNKYNLPDGVYFYRIEAEGTTKYEKVLITKPSNGCNCGKK